MSDSSLAESQRKELERILVVFRRNPLCEAFAEPVDWKALGLDDYPEVVKRPMDLGTIQQRLASGMYSKGADGYQLFFSDLYQVWTNCMDYNEEGSDLHETAKKMQTQSMKLHREFCLTFGVSYSTPLSAPRVELIKLCSAASRLDSRSLARLVRYLYQQCPGCVAEVDSASMANRVRIDFEGIPSSKLQGVQQAVRCLTALQQTH